MKKNKVTVFKINIFLLIVIGIMCVMTIIGLSGERSESSEVRNFNKGWYYLKDGKKQYVTLPAKVIQKNSNKLVLRHDTLSKNHAGQSLATKASEYRLKVYAGHDPIYEYTTNGIKRSEALIKESINLILIPQSKKYYPILMVYHAKDGVYQLPSIQIGESRALVYHDILVKIFVLMIPFVTLVLGINGILLAFLFFFKKMECRRLFFLSLFLLNCGVWGTMDSHIIEMLVGYNSLTNAVSHVSLMLLPTSLCYYIMESFQVRGRRILNYPLMLAYANTIGQIFLVQFFGMDYNDMLFMTHICLGIIAVVSFVLLFGETMFGNYKRNSISIIALTLGGICWVVDLILFINIEFKGYQILFETGVFVMTVIMIYGMLTDYIRGVKDNTELVVYRQLCEEDEMTGLKNRRAFNFLLEKIEAGKITCRDAAMIFIDLNGLKKANDELGHDVGDRLIHGIAECIQCSYRGRGVNAYRFGGDEFCVVMLECKESEERIRERLQEQIDAYNGVHSAEEQLSAAFGFSRLYDSQGVRKDVQIWQNEADAAMYRNKRKMKKAMKSKKQEKLHETTEEKKQEKPKA